MNQNELKDKLSFSLSKIYNIEAISKLAVFWQGEIHVLLYIYLHSNGDSTISPSILSDAVHVSRARIAATLASLRKKKYVTMEKCEEDRRRMRVLLTNEGKSYIEKKNKEVDYQFDALIKGLGETDVLEFIRILDSIAKIMDSKAINS